MAKTFYQILEIGVRATPEEIKAAYKKKAFEFHPDKNNGNRDSEEKFKQVLEAYQTLSDAKKKDLYDVKLFYKSITVSGSDQRFKGGPKTRQEREKDDYNNRKSDREAYREYKGPPIKERLTIQSVALTLLVFGSIAMLAYWFGDFMNRWTAKEHLRNGDYEGALHFDDTFGEAYYARFKDRQKMGVSLKVLLPDINLAIRLSDEVDYHQYMDRAALYFQMDSLEKCRLDFEMARKVNSKSDTAAFALAELHAYYFNQPKKALTFYDSTLKISPNFPEANFGRGFMLYRMKQFPLALQQFNHCIELRIQDKRVFFYRGSTQLVMGDSLAACADLDQSLTMGMDEAKPILDQYCHRFGF